MSEVKNILLVGVGGQGTILASKILTSGLMKAGYDVIECRTIKKVQRKS